MSSRFEDSTPGSGAAPVQTAAPPDGGAVDSPLRGRATVVDVARLAGVSGRTVSRVVAGGDNVSEQTRQRVADALHTLQFRPNRLARDLRTGGVSTTVGFVVGDLANIFYMRVAAGVERALGDVGLTMLLAATRDVADQELRTVGAVLEHRVRALLLVPIGEDHAYLEFERRLGTPIVGVDRPAANVDLDSVVFDNRGGASTGVQSLLAAGHRRIGFIGSDATVFTQGERLAGYYDVVRASGLLTNPAWVRTDASDAASAACAARDILSLADPPTAIFAANNIVASGVLRVLHAHERPVAFVAFDDFDFADTLGISVVTHDPGLMGSEAVRLALSRHGDPDQPTIQIVLPTHLIRRGSGEIPPSV